MHNIESRFVIGPSNILFEGVYVCTFQPGNIQAEMVNGLRTLREICVAGSIQVDLHPPTFPIPPSLPVISSDC